MELKEKDDMIVRLRDSLLNSALYKTNLEATNNTAFDAKPDRTGYDSTYVSNDDNDPYDASRN